jgi:hypothetical protein
MHWSEQLEKLLPEYCFVNLAYAGATNLSIAAQVERALADKHLAFIILNASDVFRIDVPNVKLKRKEKTGKLVVSNNELFNYNDFKKIAEKIYTEIYKNSFVSPDELYELFDHNYSVDNKNLDNSVISSFGMWSLTKELSEDIKQVFRPEVYEASIGYFRHLFDLNIRFYNDLHLFEGKLYKIFSKRIPFLYNLGGLTNKKSFLNKVFPHVIAQVENRYPELDQYRSTINFFDIQEDSHMTDSSAPGFHIANVIEHKKIAEYYCNRIAEINAS